MKYLEKIITKELLRRVLPKEIESLSDNFSFTINEDYIEFSDDGEMQFEYCIYKFTFKCKEWAKTKNYVLWSYLDQTNMFNFDGIKVKSFIGNEVETIIKACEWVLKEQNNDKNGYIQIL